MSKRNTKRAKRSKKKKEPVPKHANLLLTPELTRAIGTLVKAGNFPRVAASFSGITVRTYDRWMERGGAEATRLDENPEAEPNPVEAIYLDFFNEIQKAMAFAEVRMVQHVSTAAAEDPNFAKWWLERAKKVRWSPSNDVKIGGSGPDGEIKINVRSNIVRELRPEEILALSEMSLRYKDDGGDQSPGGDAQPEQLYPPELPHN